MTENDFQDGVSPPYWIRKILIFRQVTILEIKIRVCIRNFAKIGRFAAEISRKTFLKMAAVRHLEFSKLAILVM